MPAHRHAPSRLARLLGPGSVASALVLGAVAFTATTPAVAASASTKTIAVPGRIVALTQPLANGILWVLSGARGVTVMSQINTTTGAILGSEVVSPYADDIALSPGGATIALGTTGGAYPAIVWYSGITGRFAGANKSPAAVKRVVVNKLGNGIDAIRATKGSQTVLALGTSNGLGYANAVPGTNVDLALQPGEQSMLLLQSNGDVGSVGTSGGAYTVGFSTGGPASAMALNSAGTTLFVLRTPVKGAAGSVAEVDVSTGKVVETIAVAQNCVDVELSADGHTLYEAVRGRTTSSIKSIIVP